MIAIPLWAWVVARILANPFSNVFQKLLAQRGIGPISIVGITHAVLSAICLPWLAPRMASLPAAFWLTMLVCGLLAVAANSLIVAAVKTSDLSILGPINAYKAVVSLVPGMLILGEFPSWIGLSGIGLILLGSALIQPNSPSQNRLPFLQLFKEKGVQLRFLALILSSTEAVFLKQALHYASPLTTFFAWSITGFMVSMASALLLGSRESLGKDLAGLKAKASWTLCLAATTGAMQLSSLVTFQSMQVGYSLALFQLSTLLTVFLGHTIFDEGHFWQRLGAAGVMALGAAAIIVKG